MASVWTVLMGMVVLLALICGDSEARTVRRRRSLRAARVTNCGSSNSVLRLTRLMISPMPMIVPGTVHVTVDAESTRTVQDMKIEVELSRHVYRNFKLKMPCVADVGSCTVDSACDVLRDMRSSSMPIAQSLMRMLRRNNLPTSCPVPATTIRIRNQPIQLQDIPTAAALLTNGRYTVELRFIEDDTNVELGCYEIEVESKTPRSSYCFWC